MRGRAAALTVASSLVIITNVTAQRPPGVARAARAWITESTFTVGRGGAFRSNGSFLAGIVGVADLGARWTTGGGRSYGLSVLAGRDFPNEATLAGVRGRLGVPAGGGRIEVFGAMVASSAGSGGIGHAGGLGVVAGAAWYPSPPVALVLQVDILPTYSEDDTFVVDPRVVRKPALSGGLRLAERPGIVPWLGAGVAGLLWLAISD